MKRDTKSEKNVLFFIKRVNSRILSSLILTQNTFISARHLTQGEFLLFDQLCWIKCLPILENAEMEVRARTLAGIA